MATGKKDMGAGAIDLTVKKGLVHGLIERCPQSHNFINYGCPVSNIRKLAAENLTRYLDGLSEHQIDRIIRYHRECFNS